MRPVARGSPQSCWVVSVVAVALGVCAGPRSVAAQDYRGWSTTSVQVVELRPLGLDTVARADVLTDANGRFLYEGIEVSCVLDDICTGYLPLDDTHTVAATQDLGATYWGFGVEGLSVTGLGPRTVATRGATWYGLAPMTSSTPCWRTLSCNAAPVRVRAGQSGRALGPRASRPSTELSGVVCLSEPPRAPSSTGARSLARGLREPANSAFRALDDFFLDHGVLLLGGSLERASTSAWSQPLATTARSCGIDRAW